MLKDIMDLNSGELKLASVRSSKKVVFNYGSDTEYVPTRDLVEVVQLTELEILPGM